jgi:hypothetical protein
MTPRVRSRTVSRSTPWRSLPSGQDEPYGPRVPSSNRSFAGVHPPHSAGCRCSWWEAQRGIADGVRQPRHGVTLRSGACYGSRPSAPVVAAAPSPRPSPRDPRPARPATCATRGIRVAHGLPARARLGPRLGPRAHFAHSVTDFRGDLTGNVDAGGVQSERVMLMGHKAAGGRTAGGRGGTARRLPRRPPTETLTESLSPASLSPASLSPAVVPTRPGPRSTPAQAPGRPAGQVPARRTPTHRSRPDVQSARRVKITASRPPRQDRRTTTAAPTPSASA